MKICVVTKSIKHPVDGRDMAAGTILSMQGPCDDDTLTKQAVIDGYPADSIEQRDIDPVEYERIMSAQEPIAASSPPVTQEQLASILISLGQSEQNVSAAVQASVSSGGVLVGKVAAP